MGTLRWEYIGRVSFEKCAPKLLIKRKSCICWRPMMPQIGTCACFSEQKNQEKSISETFDSWPTPCQTNPSKPYQPKEWKYLPENALISYLLHNLTYPLDFPYLSMQESIKNHRLWKNDLCFSLGILQCLFCNGYIFGNLCQQIFQPEWAYFDKK